MIKEIRKERDGLTGRAHYFVYLRPGFGFDRQHCFGADTQKEIEQTMQRVGPCDCEECNG